MTWTHAVLRQLPQAHKRQALDSLLSPSSSSSTPPHQPVIYPSTLAARPTPPLRSPSFSRRALPSVGCYWAGISQTLPLRPVTSSAGRKSEGSSSSCESNPTHLCTFDSREGRAPRGHGGVESPYLLASHSQTTPHHDCRHMTALEGEQYQWKSGKIQVSLLPPARNGCNVAVEQCGGRDQIRKEGSKEEGALNKWRKTFVYLTINGQRCGAYMSNNRQRRLCPSIHRGIIINMKRQGLANWLVAFSLKWVSDLDCLSVSSCQSSVASTNDSGNINQSWFHSWHDTPSWYQG